MSVYARLSPRGRWVADPSGDGCRRSIVQDGEFVAIQRQRIGPRRNTAWTWCVLPDGRITPDRLLVRESLEDLAALLDSPPQPVVAPTLGELFAEIARWGLETFPLDNIYDVARKLAEEYSELMVEAGRLNENDYSDEALRSEIADCLIVLIRMCAVLGRDPASVIAEKFASVRERYR